MEVNCYKHLTGRPIVSNLISDQLSVGWREARLKWTWGEFKHTYTFKHLIRYRGIDWCFTTWISVYE